MDNGQCYSYKSKKKNRRKYITDISQYQSSIENDTGKKSWPKCQKARPCPTKRRSNRTIGELVRTIVITMVIRSRVLRLCIIVYLNAIDGGIVALQFRFLGQGVDADFMGTGGHNTHFRCHGHCPTVHHCCLGCCGRCC